MTKKEAVIFSPFLIIVVNLFIAYSFGKIIGQWAFVPMMLTCWCLWWFFIRKYGESNAIKMWLKKPNGKIGWGLLAIVVGLIPLPLFILHSATLANWTIFVPWIIIALINPWIEEFYWRGLLLDYTKDWTTWKAVLYSSVLFSVNHIAFGVNSVVSSGYDTLIATFVMGIVWAIVYIKTASLRWAILSHFMVDFLNLSAAAFMDAFDKGSW